MSKVVVYTRSHTAHAWKISHSSNVESAELYRDLNSDVEVLLVPADLGLRLPAFLDSCQAQSDFPSIITL
jgi:hypothetical protein